MFERVDDTFRDPDDIDACSAGGARVVPLADGELPKPEKMATASLERRARFCRNPTARCVRRCSFSTAAALPRCSESRVRCKARQDHHGGNLAIAFAQTGATVLLIDADLRNPSLHKKLGLDGMQGFQAI